MIRKMLISSGWFLMAFSWGCIVATSREVNVFLVLAIALCCFVVDLIIGQKEKK